MATSDDLYARYAAREPLCLVEAQTVLDDNLVAVEFVNPRCRWLYTIRDERYPDTGGPFVFPEHEFEGPLPDHILTRLRGEVAS